MAIKDMIGPSFVGTTTIKWIVTRGLTAGAAADELFVGSSTQQRTGIVGHGTHQRTGIVGTATTQRDSAEG